FLV
ncbi:surA N-terminal domain protein, partial [Vibrio cholerae HC-50A2]